MINYKKPLVFHITKSKKKAESKEKSFTYNKYCWENKTRAPWTKEEDQIVIALVEKLGTKSWTQLSRRMADEYSINYRSGKQCRERWHNHLDPHIKKDYWSEKEEAILFLKHEEFGNKWSEISKFLPGRTDNNLKNHFYSKLRKFIRKIIKILNRESLFKENNIDPLVYTPEKIYKIIKKQNIPNNMLTKDSIIGLILENDIRKTQHLRIGAYSNKTNHKEDIEAKTKQNVPLSMNNLNFMQMNYLINLNKLINPNDSNLTFNVQNSNKTINSNNISNLGSISNINNMNTVNFFNNQNNPHFNNHHDANFHDIYTMNLAKILPQMNQATINNFTLAKNTPTSEKQQGSLISNNQETGQNNNFLDNLMGSSPLHNAGPSNKDYQSKIRLADVPDEKKIITTDLNRDFSFSQENFCPFKVGTSNNNTPKNNSTYKFRSFNYIDPDLIHNVNIHSSNNISTPVNNNTHSEFYFPININTNTPTTLEKSNFDRFKNFCELQQKATASYQTTSGAWKGFSASPKSAFFKNFGASNNFSQFFNYQG